MADRWPIRLVGVAVGWAMDTIGTVAGYGLIQRSTDDAVRGRVFGAYSMSGMLANMVGFLLVGPFVEAFGPRAVYAAGGVLSLIAAGVFGYRRRPAVETESIEVEPADQSKAISTPAARTEPRQPDERGRVLWSRIGSVGTTEAFETLCRAEYEGLVRTAFLICGDAAESRDLAQETLARAFERWRTVSRLDRPGAWCRKVVVNLALTSRRRRARAARLPFQQDAVWPDEPMDEDLMAALRALGDQQRSVVVLRYLCDLSIAETAELLGKRESTVRSITSQATDRLRAALTSSAVEPIEGSPKEQAR